MRRILTMLVTGGALAALWHWYNREVLTEAQATIRLQSQHEHFHFHVDLPPGLQIQPGDTLEIETIPPLPDGRTDQEIVYPSQIKLWKASWLRRNLIRRSSIVEINELVEHP